MDYLEFNFLVEPKHPFTDILIAQLAEAGFESFCETENGVLAYILDNNFSPEILRTVDVFSNTSHDANITYTQKNIPAQNWNQLWESNFDPVKVGMECIVRAPFHEKHDGFKFDIVIEPKMSFGTGHHDTTMLMVEEILKSDMPRKRVLDMGCGTGILAILSAKMNADKIVAIDVEEWAYKNTMENCASNHTQQILVIHGGANAIPNNNFDLILANINRNVLIQDMPHYVKHLATDGRLIMSGFFVQDIDAIATAAKSNGLTLLTQTEKDSWACISFIKRK